MMEWTDPEIDFAVTIVAEACRLAVRVQQVMGGESLSKHDRTPVTAADFAVQALVGRHFAQHRDEPLVAEEDSRALRGRQGTELLERIRSFLRAEGIPEETVCEWIDRGNGKPALRFWTLDPIDGTRGFLRGGHYAVALALIVEGRVELGVMGCPTLQGGTLFAARRGQGAWRGPIGAGPWAPLRVSECEDAKQARVLRSRVRSHTDLNRLDRLLEHLSVAPEAVCMDSQAKYGLLAAGEGDLYLRLLTRPDYREAIWDQASGSLLVKEAGGRVTDLDGRELDFSAGERLVRNRGLLASNGRLHDQVLAALQQV